MRDEFSLKSCINYLKMAIVNLSKKEKIVIGCLIAAFSVSSMLLICMALNTPIQDSGLKISKLFSNIGTAETDTIYTVIRTATCSESISVNDAVSYIVDGLPGVSSYTDAVDAITELGTMAQTIHEREKEHLLLVPKGAASVDLMGIGVYQWTNTYHDRITKCPSSIGNYSIKLGNDIIQVVIFSKVLSATMEINTYQIISKE